MIIDLDDTIFPTKSMDSALFDPAISVIRAYYDSSETGVDAEEVITALWARPIDHVLLKYQVPKPVVAQFYQEISLVDYSQLAIQPFVDYEEIKTIAQQKILVTTGLKEL